MKNMQESINLLYSLNEKANIPDNEILELIINDDIDLNIICKEMYNLFTYNTWFYILYMLYYEC